MQSEDSRRTASVRRASPAPRSEEHTSELQSQSNLVCRLLLEKKKRDGQYVRRAAYAQSRPTPLAIPLDQFPAFATVVEFGVGFHWIGDVVIGDPASPIDAPAP